ncbi:PREDICTED: platelet glycoprotein Ib alpha chain-like [Nicotiana attenuata]|uniref:platelet glycoprotein Ib alpha chain-like n=1 Tax=Nicotiana attenuata TaxID=49451 RepID=UPI000904BB26|nr:PREDICTED: platelet glycoprotein Ib alpha chain-like [Nicotiana attenuata]
MPKASQIPSKAKSSTKVEAKPKILMPKSKKNDKTTREPTPTPAPSPSISSTIPTSSSPVPTAPLLVIPISIVPPPSKATTHAPELPTKNTSKTTKVKETSRKFVKKMPEAAAHVDTGVKESMIQRESGTTDQVPHPAPKLDVLASAIDVAPLYTLTITSEKSPVEKFIGEEYTGDLGNSYNEDEKDNEGEKEEEVMTSHEEHEAQNIANEEGKSKNEGVFGDEKESDTEDKIVEQKNNSAEKENLSEEEEVYESEGEDQER